MDFEGDPALEDLRSYTKSMSGGRDKVGDRYRGKPRSLLSEGEVVYALASPACSKETTLELNLL